MSLQLSRNLICYYCWSRNVTLCPTLTANNIIFRNWQLLNQQWPIYHRIGLLYNQVSCVYIVMFKVYVYWIMIKVCVCVCARWQSCNLLSYKRLVACNKCRRLACQHYFSWNTTEIRVCTNYVSPSLIYSDQKFLMRTWQKFATRN